MQDRYTPLHLASQNGYVEVVGTLIKSGADVQAVKVVSKHGDNTTT